MRICHVTKLSHILDEADIRQLTRLIGLLSPDAQPVTREIIRRRLVVHRTHLLLARDPATALLGMATLVPHPRLLRMEGWLEDVVVYETERRKGVGEALVRSAIDLARTRGFDRVSLTCEPAQEAACRLFQRVGFTRYETNTFQLMLAPPQQ